MTNTLDELQRAVERLSDVEAVLRQGQGGIARDTDYAKRVSSDLRLILSERADLLATVERMRGALESAAETLDHVDGALMDMADAGAVPAVGTWRFVTQAAKRARAALTTGEEK